MVKLHSKLLKEDIICIEDSQKPSEKGGPVCYTRSELAAMQGLGETAVHAIHKTKKHFGGTFIGPTPGAK